MDARIVPADEINSIDSSLGKNWHSALYQSNGAAIEPRLAAPAIASAAREKGAKLFQNCAVRTIERQGGKIASVITEKGEIKTANVVVASGAWSSSIGSHLDLKMPQLLIFAEMISVEPLSDGPAIAGMTPAGYFRREPDGGYMFGTAAGSIPITPTIFKNLRDLMSMPTDVDQEIYPTLSLSTFIREMKASRKQDPNSPSVFEQHRILQPEYIGNTSNEMVEGMRKYIPAFAKARVRESYTGSLFASLDNLGVLSTVQSIPGLYLGTGMLYGLTNGAAVGEALADMITGETTKFDISPYRYERFIDGSKFEFHP
jgi:glycine/D-amino acid oxidase-like deaminating enzyme